MMTIMEAVVEETAVWAVVEGVVEVAVDAVVVDAAVVDAALLASGDHGRGALEVDRLRHFKN